MANKINLPWATGVDKYRDNLDLIIPQGYLKNRIQFLTNISYNLQYLQFLDQLFKNEADLHPTVRKLNRKTFIVTGMSIVEALLWYILKKNNKHKTKSYEKVWEKESSTFSLKGSQYRIVNRIEYKRDEPIESEMRFYQMKNKVKDKALLGDVSSEIYANLNLLNKLRNKIHLQSLNYFFETDWNSFDTDKVKLMKKTLYELFESQPFYNEKSNFLSLLDFLRVDETKEELGDFPDLKDEDIPEFLKNEGFDLTKSDDLPF
mgnify:CR=1 FL=1